MSHAADVAPFSLLPIKTGIVRLLYFLPRGRELPDHAWEQRHRGVLALLWLHGVGVPLFGFMAGNRAIDGLAAGLMIMGIAALGMWSVLHRRVRACLMTIGLMGSSAMLVHLSGGYIELHFHFFVMVAVVALYQDWMPFLLGLLIVVLDHGVMGMISPHLVYNHMSGRQSPWTWAAIHGGFILAESAALLVFWRLNELGQSHALESEARTRQVIETALDAIISFDEHGRITAWNRQAEATFQWTRDEAVGQEFSQMIVSAPYRETYTRAVQHCLITGDVEVFHRRMQIVAVRRDGTWFPAEVAMSPLRIHRTYTFTAFIQDISERNLAEEELKARAAELRAANDELEAFSYSVSHDLRAPLRHIDGFAGLLHKYAAPTLDEKGCRYLSAISDAANQMSQLIDALLQLSRRGRDEMVTSQVALSPLIKGVLDEFHDEVASRDIVWSIAPLPSVRADPALLRQVFVNLIANALKYTGQRSPARIDVGGDVRSDEIVVFVRDNGVGFDMQYAHKLFGVFQRLHRRDEFEGTGIGLALVRRIVMRHGGRTWAEGAVGQGATFFFSLPLSHMVQAADPSPDLSGAVRSGG